MRLRITDPTCYPENRMTEDALNALVGPTLRIQNKQQLEEFLPLPDASKTVRDSSFEQVFFTVKTLGLADSLELLPLATERQICAFVDLDCWRKDSFARKPFMEWVAAFIQTGPESAVRALGGIDEYVVALFLKDLIEVYEIERDEPAPADELVYSPDQRFAVRQIETGDVSTIASLILDTLFRFEPDLGYSLLRLVRYTTRTELAETAYQNKTRRLDIHGFVDYYEALSIYAGPVPTETVAVPRDDDADEEIPGEEPPQPLPTVFADSLAGGRFLLSALGNVPPQNSERLADELTALGNRILSANLVNLGEVESIRDTLGEMRAFLTIGLETLSGQDLESAAQVFTANHVQTVFKAGFDQLARLRDQADQLARFPAFSVELFESPDQEFLAGLRRFKPLLWDGKQYGNFENLTDVRDASDRLDWLRTIVNGFLPIFASTETTLRKAFNTAVIRQAVSGEFEPTELSREELESFLSGGIEFPELALPNELRPIVEGWLSELHGELEPLIGQKVDPRYIGSVLMRL